MDGMKGYDDGLEFPIETAEDPFSERTIYEVERETFKKVRKNEKIEEKGLYD